MINENFVIDDCATVAQRKKITHSFCRKIHRSMSVTISLLPHAGCSWAESSSRTPGSAASSVEKRNGTRPNREARRYGHGKIWSSLQSPDRLLPIFVSAVLLLHMHFSQYYHGYRCHGDGTSHRDHVLISTARYQSCLYHVIVTRSSWRPSLRRAIRRHRSRG